ncbi:MAG TPA: ABC transporter permease, partial [Kribbella sp.]
MVNFLIRRLLAAVALLIIVSMVTFAIFFLVPRLTGASTADLASRYVGKTAGPQAIHEVEIRLGLNRPLVIQYWNFVKGIVIGAHYNFGPSKVYCGPPCFGYSFVNQTPVWPDLLDRMPVTLSLAGGAAIIFLVVGITVGTISGTRRHSLLDRVTMGGSLVAISAPVYWLGLVSLYLFADDIGKVKIFMGSGTYVPFSENPATWFGSLLLP